MCSKTYFTSLLMVRVVYRVGGIIPILERPKLGLKEVR